MELILILSDQTKIKLTDGNFIQKFTTICNTKEQVLYLWNKMTPANTSIAWIQLGGQTIQVLTGLIVDGLQISYNKDDTYTVHFYFYGASYAKDIEQEYVQAAKILLGEE